MIKSALLSHPPSFWLVADYIAFQINKHSPTGAAMIPQEILLMSLVTKYDRNEGQLHSLSRFFLFEEISKTGLAYVNCTVEMMEYAHDTLSPYFSNLILFNMFLITVLM